MRVSLTSLIIAIAAGTLSAGGCSGLPFRKNSAEASLPSPRSTVAKGEAAESKNPLGKLFAGKPKVSEAEQEAAAANAETQAAIIRGKGYEDSAQYEKAKRLYHKILTNNPRHPEATHRMGVVADAMKNHAEAEELFQRAIKLNPQNIEAYSDLGYCYFLQGKLSEAQGALSQAIAMNPKNPLYHNNLGLVLGHMGRFEEAFAEFKSAGAEADAYYNMAFVFATTDHLEEAKECFREALALKPSFKAAKEALASFEKMERMSDANGNERPEFAAKRSNLVPYIEPGQAAEAKIAETKSHSNGDVAQVGYNAPTATSAPTLPRSNDVSRFTRALHQRSTSTLDHHMASQRGDTRTNKVSGTPRATANGLQVSGGQGQ